MNNEIQLGLIMSRVLLTLSYTIHRPKAMQLIIHLGPTVSSHVANVAIILPAAMPLSSSEHCRINIKPIGFRPHLPKNQNLINITFETL